MVMEHVDHPSGIPREGLWGDGDSAEDWETIAILLPAYQVAQNLHYQGISTSR